MEKEFKTLKRFESFVETLNEKKCTECHKDPCECEDEKDGKKDGKKCECEEEGKCKCDKKDEE